MKLPYKLGLPYIPVQVSVSGLDSRVITLQLLLDTGAARTLVSPTTLELLGYNPASAVDRVRMTTVSGIEYSPMIQVRQISALGLDRADFAVVMHALPENAPVDGLLGMDFIQGHVLTIDTIAHTVELI